MSSATSSTSSSISSNSTSNQLKSQFQSKPTLVALTNEALLFYDQVPQILDEWLSPSVSYSLLISRVVVQNQKNPACSSEIDEKNLYFLTRHGTSRRGTVSHLFRCLGSKDFLNWTTLIDRQIIYAVNLVKHVDFLCTWHSRECKLNLHFEYGFKLYDLNQNNALLWQQSFDKLRRSADNNQNLLWLDFENDEGEIVSNFFSTILVFKIDFIEFLKTFWGALISKVRCLNAFYFYSNFDFEFKPIRSTMLI